MLKVKELILLTYSLIRALFSPVYITFNCWFENFDFTSQFVENIILLSMAASARALFYYEKT